MIERDRRLFELEAKGFIVQANSGFYWVLREFCGIESKRYIAGYEILRIIEERKERMVNKANRLRLLEKYGHIKRAGINNFEILKDFYGLCAGEIVSGDKIYEILNNTNGGKHAYCRDCGALDPPRFEGCGHCKMCNSACPHCGCCLTCYEYYNGLCFQGESDRANNDD